jgi:hypothetical protein
MSCGSRWSWGSRRDQSGRFPCALHPGRQTTPFGGGEMRSAQGGRIQTGWRLSGLDEVPLDLDYLRGVDDDGGDDYHRFVTARVFDRMELAQAAASLRGCLGIRPGGSGGSGAGPRSPPPPSAPGIPRRLGLLHLRASSPQEPRGRWPAPAGSGRTPPRRLGCRLCPSAGRRGPGFRAPEVEVTARARRRVRPPERCPGVHR